jgi:hypothetical protein
VRQCGHGLPFLPGIGQNLRTRRSVVVTTSKNCRMQDNLTGGSRSNGTNCIRRGYAQPVAFISADVPPRRQGALFYRR